MNTDKRLITIPSFARSIGVSTWLARQMVRNQQIPTKTVGKREMVDSVWVQRWLDGAPQHQQ